MEVPPTGLLTGPLAARRFVDVTAFVTGKGVDFEATDLLIGQSLTVVFRGERHTVYVVPCPSGKPECWYARKWGRYIYRGERHKTLTSIARLIAGPSDPRSNGNRFFGLRRRRRGP